MKIELETRNTGIHAYIRITASNIDIDDMDFLKKIVKEVSIFNKEQVDNA